jgi:preprotein translocase subunit YajC
MDKSQAGKRIRMNSDMVETIAGQTRVSLEAGLEGTIKGTDDTGQIHVDWDNGSTLAVSEEYGDDFTILESKDIKKFGEYIKEEFGKEQLSIFNDIDNDCDNMSEDEVVDYLNEIIRYCESKKSDYTERF